MSTAGFSARLWRFLPLRDTVGNTPACRAQMGGDAGNGITVSPSGRREQLKLRDGQCGIHWNLVQVKVYLRKEQVIGDAMSLNVVYGRAEN